MTTITTTQEQVKPQKRVQVMAGDNLNDIDKLGSDGQKIAKYWFSNSDYDKNNKMTFNEYEAKNFNGFTISSRPGRINLYHKETGREIEIKYNEKSLKDLQDVKYMLNEIHAGEVNLSWGEYKNEKGKDCIKQYVGYIGDYSKLSIDTVNNTLTVIGGDGNAYGRGLKKATFKDCSMELIKVNAKVIELKNVKKESPIFFLPDSPTQVITNRENQVKYDENSKVEIEYEKE